MQAAVMELLALGPLPDSAEADVKTIEKFQTLIVQVEPPVSDEDARALISLFGPDDCFGLAWTLVHLIETAPGWPLADALDGRFGEWIETLNGRSSR